MARQSPPRAFTLIELLVVIAVIAVLAAILFPVFSQAREKGHSIVCTSNMRQLSIAWSMYAQDYSDTLPLTAALRPGGGLVYWMEMVEPYLKAGVQVSARNTTVIEESRSVFTCPDYAVPAPDRDDAAHVPGAAAPAEGTNR